MMRLSVSNQDVSASTSSKTSADVSVIEGKIESFRRLSRGAYTSDDDSETDEGYISQYSHPDDERDQSKNIK